MILNLWIFSAQLLLVKESCLIRTSSLLLNLGDDESIAYNRASRVVQ